MADRVLVEAFAPAAGAGRMLRQVALVAAGILALVVAAKIRVPMWPVPVTMGTFAVLTLGAIYGPRLGLATILGYLALGAAGVNVFAGSGETAGLAYMFGGTGGYLFGYVLAIAAVGALARRGWDRSAGRMAVALLLGNVLIYAPGLLWLGQLYGWDQPILAWGMTPFLLGDALKLALAAMLVPALWRVAGPSRG
ncbi:biotin transporter BioY [Roseitranquillus sediminis]|uniref:biotin transporter BioY n=1 Tax=Roseitranquillus sediminis TaxID=2809051 RepID=UPI001D0C8138|nr:biotin transporter BioY [Roseitranquillus sediminis]